MPTDRGALFLQYARRILMEMESIEALELYLYWMERQLLRRILTQMKGEAIS